MTIFIQVKDHIDIEKEISKSQKKLEGVIKLIQNINQKMKIKDYDTKTPEDIKVSN